MKILALEAYYGGSHKAFLDGWIKHSRHDWTLLTLPATKWRWRMRHSAATFAGQIRGKLLGHDPEFSFGKSGHVPSFPSGFPPDNTFDAIFCSDMLNLAEFRGLAPKELRLVPAVAYFHENQLTYPVREESERDYHFMFSNMMTALSADSVWFNSEFHKHSFLSALRDFLKRMPDHQPLEEVGEIESKSVVRYPGIDPLPARGPRREGPLRILWAARWEPDKRPDVFFEAIDILDRAGEEFELSVIGGGRARDILPAFEEARDRFGSRVIHWGFVDARAEYEKVLVEADVVVSTADHEFFGISIVEAVAAGAYPLVPRRLAYPEVLKEESFFYEGGAEPLAARLCELSQRLAEGDLWQGDPGAGIEAVSQYKWDNLVPDWDDEMEQLGA